MTIRIRRIGRVAGLALLALVAGCAQAPSEGATAREAPAASDVPPVSTASGLGSYLAGGVAQRDHNYAAAAEYLERTLKHDPDNVDLLRRAFLLRVSAGQMDRATALARRLVVVDPGSSLASLVLLVAQEKAGDEAGAAASAERLSSDGLLRFSAPLVVAWTRTGQHDAKGALEALDRLDRIRGFEQLKTFHLALIDDFVGNAEGASAAYKKIIAGAERLNWRTAEMAGRFYERHGQAAEAKALYERFAKENPGNSELVQAGLQRIAAGEVPPPVVGGVKDGLAEAMFDIASVLNQRDTEDLSLVYAQFAIELEPKHGLARLLVAEIADSQQRLQEALATYRSIDPSSPFSWQARMRAAEVLDQLDRTDEAIAELKKLAADRPNSSQPLIELGDILRGRNRFAEAVTAYDEAVARIPQIEPRHWALLYSRGIALERSGQWPRAEADFERALELQPDQPLVLNYLGYSWVEKGQHLEKALKMIERAVELRPSDGYIVDSLGWAFFQLGRYNEATQYLEHALELLPQDPTINDHLGDAYWRSGREAEARYQWRRALQFKPEADQVKTIEAKLDKGLTAPPATGARGG
jgi:tetratricopeptide (TPR) repeat protein